MLRRLAGYHGRLPQSMLITEKIEVEDRILASGGFSDTRSGKYMGRLVAVKTLRVAEHDNIRKLREVSISDIFACDALLIIVLQRFCKEVVLWGTVSHPNILKFVGVQGDINKGQFITVSEWMAHGNIMDFIRKSYVNRLELVRDFTFTAAPFTKTRQQLHGAAQGLKYLHGANLVHGDLKGVGVSVYRNRFPF